jgi:hypothetical protein
MRMTRSEYRASFKEMTAEERRELMSAAHAARDRGLALYREEMAKRKALSEGGSKSARITTTQNRAANSKDRSRVPRL